MREHSIVVPIGVVMDTIEMLSALEAEVAELTRRSITRAEHRRLIELQEVVGQTMPRDDDIIRLFNPYHDEGDGRFTTATGGKSYGAAAKEGAKRGALVGAGWMGVTTFINALAMSGSGVEAAIASVQAMAIGAVVGAGAGAAGGVTSVAVGNAYRKWKGRKGGEESEKLEDDQSDKGSDAILRSVRSLLVALIGDKEDGDLVAPEEVSKKHGNILSAIGFTKSDGTHKMNVTRAMELVLKINKKLGG